MFVLIRLELKQSRELAEEQRDMKELTSTVDYYDIIEYELDNERVNL